MEEPVTIPGKPYIESELVEYIEQHDRWVNTRLTPSMLIDKSLGGSIDDIIINGHHKGDYHMKGLKGTGENI